MRLIGRFVTVMVKAIIWNVQYLIPRNQNKWIFGSWFGERYSDNSRSMYEYVLNNRPDIKALWVTKNHSVYERLKKEGKPVEMCSSLKAILFALTSRVAFITVVPEEVNGLYLNGAKMVWLWHGMPMKYIEADERKFIEGDNYNKSSIYLKIKNRLFPFDKKRVDCILSLGSFFIPFFQSSFLIDNKKVWMDGYPRNDELFSSNQENIIIEARKRYPSAKFILYMPTHRLHGLGGAGFCPFDSYGFDDEVFSETLRNNDYVFFYKGHYYDAQAVAEFDNERFIHVSDNDIDNLYRFVKDIDILITDFSSIYFDFLLLKRPIILAPFDYDDYIRNERPLYFDYNTLEAPKVSSWIQLIQLLRDNNFIKPTEEEINKYITYKDGNSCVRLYNHIIQSFELKKLM